MKQRTKQTFSLYWQHASRYKLTIFVLIFSLIAAVTTEVLVPLWYRKFFNLLAEDNRALVSPLVHILVVVLSLKFLQWSFWRVATFTNNFFQPRVMADLVNTCFQYLHGHSYNFFNSKFVGSLVRKVNRFERGFEDVADQIYWHIGKAILRVGLIMAVVYTVEPILFLMLVGWVLLYTTFQIAFSRFKLPYDIRQAETDSRVTGYLADTISNNINLKLFTASSREARAFKKLTHGQFKIRKLSWDLGAAAEAIQGALMITLEFLVLYISLRFWSRGILNVGDLVLIQIYLIQVFDELWDLGRFIRRIYESLADAEEMTEILMTPHEVADLPNAPELVVNEGKIEFDSVTFGYHPPRKVFKNFHLSILPGQRVALIGPSGGGKTTVVKLLFRFMDIQGGEVKIDGQNIAKVSQGSLREAIALVPQEPILFHRSLMENIRYARPHASDEEVFKAAKLAHCHEFITTFPDGYGTYVGERGVKLSGGERQRVAIARAILKDAPILVLDEATSSLDSESERYIQDALKNLMKDRTTIVIAHRLSTIMQMDRIIVIDKGRIAEEGRHEELLKIKQGIYQKLWGIQAGGFRE